MATTIATNVGTLMSAATGRPNQVHLVYGINSGRWYLFYLTGTQVLSLAYASSFTGTWTISSAPFTLARIHNSEGRNFGFAYDNISGNDIVHMNSTYFSSTASIFTYHSRFKLDTGVNPLTGWTTTNNETLVTSRALSAASNPSGATVGLDSLNTVRDCSCYINSTTAYTDQRFETNAVTDTAATWSPGAWTQAVSYAPSTYVTSNAWADTGSGHHLNVCDNASASGSFTQLEWSQWTTAWSAAATVLASTVTTTTANQWGMVARTTTEVHVVALSDATSNYVHRIFNGTSWSNGASIPVLTIKANGGIFLATDSTTVWAFAIDSSNNVKYISYSGGAWSGSWTTLDAGAANSRTYITGNPVATSSGIGVVWTEVNGSNFNIAGAFLPISQLTTLPVADVPSGAVTVTTSVTGTASTTPSIADVACSSVSMSAAPVGVVSTTPLVADVAVSGVSMSGAPTGSVATTLTGANVSVAGQTMTIELVSTSQSTILTTAAVTATGVLLSASGSGSASISPSVSNVSTVGQSLSISGSGTSATTLTSSNVSASALAPTIIGTGGIQLSLATGSVLVGTVVPTISFGLVTTTLTTANVPSSGVALTIGTSGTISKPIGVSDVSVSAAPMTASSSAGTVSVTLSTADVAVAGNVMSASGSGVITGSISVADTSVAAQPATCTGTGYSARSISAGNVSVSTNALSVQKTTIEVTLGNALVLASCVPITKSVTGSAVASISIANTVESANLGGQSVGSIFTVLPEMTTLIF